MITRVAALLLITVCTACATVDTGYRGVKLQFGKPTGEILTEGLYFFNPLFGQKIVQLSVQTVKDEVKSQASSQDLQNVDATVSVNYHLDGTKVVNIYDTLRDEYEVRIINPTVQESVKAATARFHAQDLIQHRTEVRDYIDKDLRARVQAYGIVVDQVLITDFQFDKKFQDAVEAKVAAQQELLTAQIDAQKAKTIAIGQAQAQTAQRVSLTPLLLQKAMLDLLDKKWDGHFPTYMSGSSPLNLLLSPSSKD